MECLPAVRGGRIADRKEAERAGVFRLSEPLPAAGCGLFSPDGASPPCTASDGAGGILCPESDRRICAAAGLRIQGIVDNIAHIARKKEPEGFSGS